MHGGLNMTIWHPGGFFLKVNFLSVGFDCWSKVWSKAWIQAIITEDLWHGVAMLIFGKTICKPVRWFLNQDRESPFQVTMIIDQPCKIDCHCSLWYPPGPQTVIMLLPSEQGVLHFLFLKPRFKLWCTQIWGPIVSCQLRWHSGSPIYPSPHYCQQGKATKIVMWYLIQIWNWQGIFLLLQQHFLLHHIINPSTSSLWRVAQLWSSVTGSSSWLLWTVMIKRWENLGGVEKNE